MIKYANHNLFILKLLYLKEIKLKYISFLKEYLLKI
jgi:hypothetical protein